MIFRVAKLVTLFVVCARPMSILERNLRVGKVRLEKTGWSQVTKEFGPATVETNGQDASEYERYVCYLGSDGTALRFSSSEMGGGDIIDAFELATDMASIDFGPEGPAPTPPLRCSSSIKVSARSATHGGLHLGMRKQEVRAALGSPTIEQSDLWRYSASFQIEIGHQPAESFDREEDLELLFRNDGLLRIRGWQTTSN